MRRAMTMVEMLVAVALLAMVMVASSQWLALVGSLQNQSTEQPLLWRQSAQQTLQLIHDAISCGDFDETNKNRVFAEEKSLRIYTRSITSGNGPEEQTYQFDEYAQRLDVYVQNADGQSTTRPLLENVKQWTCAFNEEQKILTVQLESTFGESVARRYAL